MNCPLCHTPFKESEIETTDKQISTIYECLNCGGHFFPRTLINFITSHDAKNIDSVIPQKPGTHHDQILTCPQCNQNLITISDDAVPHDVTIYACPEGHGDFYPKDELGKFKKAQEIKLDYHKTWGIPLKSIFTILLPVIIFFSAVTVLPLTLERMRSSQENRTKASNLLTQPLITPISSTQTVISFSTTRPYYSFLNLASTNQPPQKITISESATTNHMITLKDLSAQTKYTFTITLSSTTSATTTPEYSFSTP